MNQGFKRNMATKDVDYLTLNMPILELIIAD